MTKPKPLEPISMSKSIEEQAEFWDSHDLTDYWREGRPVKLKVKLAKPLSYRLEVRMDVEMAGELAKEARAKGLAISTLARMWLKERVEGRRVVDEEGR